MSRSSAPRTSSAAPANENRTQRCPSTGSKSTPGASVEGTLDEIDDPVLIGPDGLPVDTWREGYPYGERMSRRSTRSRSGCCRSNC